MQFQKKYDVIVIGAGASGLIAAGRAGELGSRVVLMERMAQPGRKLLITGKGRCNITNIAETADFISHIQPNGQFLRHAFSVFFSQDIIDLLHTFGVDTVSERGGRIFPASNKSSDVLEALLKWINKNKVVLMKELRILNLIIKDQTIIGVEAEKNGQKEKILARNVIICTGGISYPATGSTGDGFIFARNIGHIVEPLRQSLVPVETSGDIAGRLKDLTLKNVKATVWSGGKKCKEAFGEMLFTDFGLSGPIILTLSRFIVDELRIHHSVEISVDLKPALNDQKLDARLIRDLNTHGKLLLKDIFRLWLPVKMIPVFIHLLSLDPFKAGHQISAKERQKILFLMKDMRFKITGVRPFKEAIITAGGVNTDQINPKTMESRLIKNLYFAGEILDLDADTGGYNLQIAWSTGWLAGNSAAQNKS
jgi:predicted Rossmann fold flavoprotein